MPADVSRRMVGMFLNSVRMVDSTTRKERRMLTCWRGLRKGSLHFTVRHGERGFFN